MSESKLPIGETASLLGITPKAIRHYHQLGLLDEPARADNGYRLYGIDELARLEQIVHLQKLGLSLKQIRFIFNSADPDDQLRQFLRRRDDAIEAEIARLRAQQTALRLLIDAEQPLTPEASGDRDTAGIVRDALRPVSGGLADAILTAEGIILSQFDRYRWSDRFDSFWYEAAVHMASRMRAHEHRVILWIERYLALADLTPDDRQAQAWLADLATDPVRPVLANAWRLPPGDTLEPGERARAEQLLRLFFLESGTPLQRQFIAILLHP